MITPAAVDLKPLTDRQRVVLAIIARYYVENEEPIAIRLLARRLKCSYSTARGHVHALHRKGWVVAPSMPRPRALLRKSADSAAEV